MDKSNQIKKQILSQITQDIYEGVICSDSNSTLSFITSLIELLSGDSLEIFARNWEYLK